MSRPDISAHALHRLARHRAPTLQVVLLEARHDPIAVSKECALIPPISAIYHATGHIPVSLVEMGVCNHCGRSISIEVRSPRYRRRAVLAASCVVDQR